MTELRPCHSCDPTCLRDSARRLDFTVQLVNRVGLHVDDNIRALLRKGPAPA
ncbi:hypothetical protein [uncultured Tateyamaria sp.]|uniref:hypothetical protein n=1 Tax=uncultured Tateyamaria sp. TaxID=455651 RepID=UPI002605EF9F|nr:hypothetical protein [uncultured Tateyamaria sp.]